MARSIVYTFVLALAVLNIACGPSPDTTPSELVEARDRTAVAVLAPAEGSQVRGQVTFHEINGRIHVLAEVTGLNPGQLHGFHIHEKGDCGGPDFAGAGGHFNPAGHPHGAPEEGQHHAGDLGNIVADSEGVGRFEKTVGFITLTEGPSAVVGLSVIVHADPDDLVSQPTGAAGARLACGIIALQ